MLLKSIKVKNFRQFKGEQNVSFSIDTERNVTIIRGDNGSGKTSFAQAFRWCLYGETDFSDPILLSKAISDQMLPNDEDEVSVQICLIHNDVEYTVLRQQKYKKYVKEESLRISNVERNKFFISYKEADGNIKYVPDNETELKMREILPSDLSRYFFFDGEHIDRMAKEIQQKGRSSDFSNAVKSLLGLDAFLAALKHLNNKGKNSVIGRYEESYNLRSEEELSKVIEEIGEYKKELEKIEKRLSEFSEQEKYLKDQCNQLRVKIEKNQDSKELIEDRDRYNMKLEDLNKQKKLNIALLLENFNSNNALCYLSKKMMKDALELLKSVKKLDKGIPDVTARTIDYLIEHKCCLCGSKFDFKDDIFNTLNELKNYIPPKSIGNLISEFSLKCEDKAKSTNNFFDNFSNNIQFVCGYDNERNNIEDKLKKINDRLSKLENVGHLQKDLMKYEYEIKKISKEYDDLNQEKGVIKNNLKNLDEKRGSLAFNSKNNREIEIYRTYAQYMYNELSQLYKIQESDMRERLEKTVNSIFKNIYNGSFSLSLSPNYEIILTADDRSKSINDNIETSTAQSNSIILAFIAGIIKIVKENNNNPKQNLEQQIESYPLVMDAPLSAFDIKRINTICEVLPKIAEQVIIFIKDTDGNLAEKNLGKKIGKCYTFVKKVGTEFETYIEEVK